MAFDFSTLVTDRTQQDVAYARQLAEKLVTGNATEAEIAEWNSFTLKGVYNHTDLNRVTAAMEDLKLRLEGYGYAVPGYQRIVVPHVIPESKPTSKLPEGYLELTHIESTGTQYINTGVVVTNNTKIELKCATTNGNFYAATADGSTRCAFFVNAAGALDACFGTDNYMSNVATGISFPAVITLENGTVTTNGSVYSFAPQSAFSIPHPFFLFAQNANGSPNALQYGECYYCKIWEGGVIVRDYIPCINPDGAVGLYDLVTAAFFGNSGTGSFVAGAIPRELPEGYTQVEYIQSSGTQYIDTGFKPTNNTKVELKVSTNTGNFYTAINSSSRFGLYVISGGRIDIAFGATGYVGNVITGETFPAVVTMENGKITANESVYTFAKQADFSIAYTLPLFASNTNGTIGKVYGECYYCKIWEGDILVRDFVPCKNSSGVFGLYDLANNVFYQNAGSGTFAAGEEIVAPVTASVSVVSNDLTECDPYTWYEFDWPTPETMTVYLLNVSAIRAVLDMLSTTPKTPADMELLTWAEANDIEQILLDVETVIYQMVNGFQRSGAFTFWSGHKPLPSATSDKGRTWEEQDAMNTTWANWQLADWYLLLYGNLKAEGVIE